MRIHLAQRFPCTPQRYWEVTRGAAFEDAIRAEANVDFEVETREERGSVTFERVRVSPRREMTAIAQRALGMKRLVYAQETEADNATLTTVWRVFPAVMAERVRCAGTARVVAVDGGCERTIEGEIAVAIPLVGGLIESQIISTLQRAYEQAADVILRFLNAPIT